MSRATDYLSTSETLKKIEQNEEKHLIIHYACEPFNNTGDGKSLKIVSIAIRNLSDGQTNVFSIPVTAETFQHTINNIQEEYLKIEKTMLDEYFNFVKSNHDKVWIHWNMRDNYYGFKALEHRYKVLGGNPIYIPDDKKIDLSILLIQRYTDQYVNITQNDSDSFSGTSRMQNLAELNKINLRNFLPGETEAMLFSRNDFIPISRSTSTKVQVFSDIIHKILNSELKVETPKRVIYGNSVKGYYLRIENHSIGKYFLKAFWFITGVLSTLFIEYFFK